MDHEHQIEDINIDRQIVQTPPKVYKEKFPLTPQLAERVYGFRKNIEDVMFRKDDRLMVVVGPCSIHNAGAAINYAEWLKDVSDQIQDKVLVVMRAYIEKPRTVSGWKGLRRDPNLDGSNDVEKGTELSRKLFRDITQIGLPIATEFVYPRTPQFVGDFVSWGAVGARTTEGQTHRELVSGLSMPIGWKNGTSGDIDIAINSVIASRNPDVFEGFNDEGQTTYEFTRGNKRTHIILRGGKDGPNHHSSSVKATAEKLGSAGLSPYLMVDCSHDNSGKGENRYLAQVSVAYEVINQASRDPTIFGIMLESYNAPGRQKIVSGRTLDPDISVTDGCIGREETFDLLKYAHKKSSR